MPHLRGNTETPKLLLSKVVQVVNVTEYERS